jgi:hypothetical protein
MHLSIEHLPCMYKALGLIPSTTKKQRERERQRQRQILIPHLGKIWGAVGACQSVF